MHRRFVLIPPDDGQPIEATQFSSGPCAAYLPDHPAFSVAVDLDALLERHPGHQVAWIDPEEAE